MATAASTAFPPASRIWAPASAPCGFATETTPCWNALPVKEGGFPLAFSGSATPGAPIVSVGAAQTGATASHASATATSNVRLRFILPPQLLVVNQLDSMLVQHPSFRYVLLHEGEGGTHHRLDRRHRLRDRRSPRAQWLLDHVERVCRCGAR